MTTQLEKLKRKLEAWESMDTTKLDPRSIQMDERLQARVERIETYDNQEALRRKSASQVDDLHRTITSALNFPMTPPLVADIKGVLYVVDGFHRTKAYLRAKLDMPARVMKTNWNTAARIAGIANCHLRARELTRTQRSEQCWQFLMGITRNGRIAYSGDHEHRFRFIVNT
jgi:hypothetical protein